MAELTFPAPNRPLSINQTNRMHWAERRRVLKPWKDIAALTWKQQGRAVAAELDGQKVLVVVSLPFATKARRDPHNYIGTVVKAIIDGLVAAGMKPDDTPEYIRVAEPALVVSKDAQVRIRLEPTGERDGR